MRWAHPGTAAPQCGTEFADHIKSGAKSTHVAALGYGGPRGGEGVPTSVARALDEIRAADVLARQCGTEFADHIKSGAKSTHVAALGCGGPRGEAVPASVARALDEIRAADVLARLARILIKPNLVTPSPFPVTTPPQMCRAVVDPGVSVWFHGADTLKNLPVRRINL